MSIEVDIDEGVATFTVSPTHGRKVVFEVRERHVITRGGTRLPARWVVGLKGSDGEGFSSHKTFELAVERAMSRALRYERAYRRPHGVRSAA